MAWQINRKERSKMVKWDTLRKTERDNEIFFFWLCHRDMSHLEIAGKEKMSRTNATRIINGVKARLCAKCARVFDSPACNCYYNNFPECFQKKG